MKASHPCCSCLLALALVIGVAPALALDLTGSLQAWTGPIRSDVSDNDQLSQRYRIELSQEISPWLRALVAYRYTDYLLAPELGPDFSRSTSEPRLALIYDRPSFSAQVSAQSRAVRSSISGQDIDLESIWANLEWEPSWGPRFILRFRDEVNTLDPAVFPRETEFDSLAFNVLYDRRLWSARYTYTDTRTFNREQDFSVEDHRHELRTTYNDQWWQDRLFFSLDARGALLERVQELPAGGSATQPVPVREGLFALDTSPAVGELAPSPGLVDGDRAVPVSPRIEIGGASTFRNIGVDLGVTRPITQLEVSVDQPSSAGVIWEVWQSPDNLSWFRVTGVTSTFDDTFLRYVIDLPETTNLFFKAVNVSSNTAPLVAVTEIRALVTTIIGGSTEADGDEYWVNMMAGIIPWRRASLTFTGSTRKDITLTGGRSGRSRKTDDYGAQLRIDLTDHLELGMGYRSVDIEENQDPFLLREETYANLNLRWRPLETVDVLLSANRRDETTDSEPIRLQDSYVLTALTDLLPRLRLISNLTYLEIEDPFFGFDQTSYRWGETLEARPFEPWILEGSFVHNRYDSTGIVSLTDRNTLGVSTTWFVVPYLSLSGDWNYSVDNIQSTLSQRYALVWAPGPRLSVTATYQQTSSSEIRKTSNMNVTTNYRLNRWMRFWLTAARSEFEQLTLPSSATTTLRIGTDIVF